jgi:hypothetical protein
MGAIQHAPEGTNILRAFQGNEQPPLVASASSLLDREAEDWLLALAIIETVYYSIQEHISAQRSMAIIRCEVSYPKKRGGAPLPRPGSLRYSV